MPGFKQTSEVFGEYLFEEVTHSLAHRECKGTAERHHIHQFGPCLVQEKTEKQKAYNLKHGGNNKYNDYTHILDKYTIAGNWFKMFGNLGQGKSGRPPCPGCERLAALQDELEQQTDDQIVSVDSRPGPSGTTSISRTLSNTWRSVKSRKKKKQMLEVNRS